MAEEIITGADASKETDSEKATNMMYIDKAYITALREEAKNNRITAKNYETKLRGVLGVTPDADLTDIDTVVSTHKTGIEKRVTDALAKANDHMIKAEIKALASTYDVKLLERLIDKSKLTIENDEVKGFTEMLAALELDFPSIKKVVVAPVGNTGFNPAGTPPPIDTSKMSTEQYMEYYKKRETKQ